MDTFYGARLLPRDRDLSARMEEVSPVITRETTMWKAWIGFNPRMTRAEMLHALIGRPLEDHLAHCRRGAQEAPIPAFE